MADKEREKKLIEIVKDAIERDKELRDKYQIGDKFRFVRDRLHKLLDHLQENLKKETTEKKENTSSQTVIDSDLYVYVYLFNAHGLDLRSWAKMVTPKRFYEYSVNRPIYLNQTEVEKFIKHKHNKVQHGYLIVAINKDDVLQKESGKDSLGYALIKVREGSLHFEKFTTFIHNEHSYIVNEEGELIKKS